MDVVKPPVHVPILGLGKGDLGTDKGDHDWAIPKSK